MDRIIIKYTLVFMMVLFLGGCAKAEVQETEYTDEVEEKEISICQDNSIVNDESASVHDADFEIILGSLYADFVYDEEELPSEVVDNRIGTVMVNDEAHDWFFHNYTDFSIYTTDYNHVIGDFSGKQVYIMQIVLHTPRFKTEKGIAVGAKLDELNDAYENKLICDENEVYRNIEGNVVTQFVVKQEIVEEIHLYYRENTQAYPEVYHTVCEQEDIRKVALLYLDEDTIPELLTVQEEEYKLYTVRDDAWGDLEYVDFDNDGEDEMILHGYAGVCMFFDVIGDTVYLLLITGSTTDVASVAMLNGKNVIERTDLTHVGRKSYRIITLDACGCPIDYFHLYTGYEGDTYSPEDVFEYRNEEISMEEFEEILAGIQPLTEEK